MKKFYAVIGVLFTFFPSFVWGQASLPLSRTAWATNPTGWTSSGGVNRTTSFACSGNDGGSLQSTGSYYRVFFNSAPSTLSYSLKSGGISGTYKVQESIDGTTWTDVASLTSISPINTCNAQNHSLLSTSRYVQFIYSNRVSGNVDIDDVSITAAACSSPSTQASGLSFSSVGANQQTLDFTRGNGTGGVLIIGRAGSAPTDPGSGTSYTGNLNFGSGTAVGSGYAVYNNTAAGTGTLTSQQVSNLSAETQYYYNLYEWNSTGTCYNLTELPGSAWTLSTAPAAHPAGFTATACNNSSLALAFSAAGTITNADGYIILRRSDGTYPSTTGITNGAAPASLSLPAGTTLVTTISSTATISYTDGSLTAGQQYHYLIIPYNANASATAQTYNYYISGTPLTATATVGNASAASDIIESPSFVYSADIAYNSFQGNPISNTSNSVGVLGLRLRDGGTSNDADNLPTVLKSITFSVNSVAQSAVRRFALFQGNSFITEMANPGTATVTFSGLSISTLTDFGTTDFTLRVSFNNTAAAVTDNTQMSFSVSSAQVTADCATASSQFGSFATVNSNVTGNNNRIEVTATALAFVQQPSGAINGAAMTPSVTVKGVDANNVQDLDFAAAVSVSCSSPGVLTGDPVSVTASGAIATFTGLVHTVDGTYTMTAASGGLTAAVSNPYVIATFTYAAGDYRSKYDGDNLSSNNTPGLTDNWEYFDGTSWTTTPGDKAPQNAAVTPTRIIIDHIVYGGGSTTHKYNDIIIRSGGELILQDVDIPPVASEFINAGKKIEVLSNGKLTVKGDIDLPITGNLIVRTGGKMEIDYATMVNDHPMWDGVELFENGSTVTIKNWNFGASATVAGLMNISTAISSNADGWKFGNLVYNVNTGTNDWTIIGGGIGIINLVENDFTISNASATNYINGATNKTGTNGFVVNGNLTILDGNFGFGTSYSSDPFSHQFTINGNFTYSGNDALKSHRIGASNPTGLTGYINCKGNFTVGSSCTGFSSDKSTANTVLGLNLNGSGSQAQELTIYPTVTAVPVTVKTGASVLQKSTDITLNALTSVTADFTVETGATYNWGWNDAGTTANVIKLAASNAGTSRFISQTDATLKITHPNGLMADPATDPLGNVQGLPLSNRQINTLATFWYLGKVNQNTGDALGNAVSNSRVVIVDLADNSLVLTPTVPFSLTNNASSYRPFGGMLDIQKGQFIETTTNYITGSTGTLHMSTGTLYKIMKGSATAPLPGGAYGDLIPRMTGGTYPYVLSGGTIELGGNTAGNYFQVLRADNASYNYYNVKYSGSNTYKTDYKALSNQTNIDNSLIITGSPVVDCIDNSGTASSFVGAAGIIMDGGRLRLKNSSGAQPELTGTAAAYALTGGVVEFYNSGTVGNQTVKGVDGNSNAIEYNQVEVTGNKVGNSNANITLRSGGTFTVKTGGQFEINDNSIVGPSGSQTLTVEDGGFFKCGNNQGFHGFTQTLTQNSSVHPNIENIVLNSGSNVIYTRIGDQPITNADVNGSPLTYSDLTIAGTGTKLAPSGVLTVRDSLKKESSSVFSHNNGTVLFSNAAAQQYYTNTGTTAMNFYNLTNSSSFGTGLNLEASLGIANTLTLSDASKLNLTSGYVSLLSTVAATARVAPVNTGSITYNTGRFVVERYYPAKRSWRLITAPVTIAPEQSVFRAWQQGGGTFGTGVVGSGTYVTGPNPNLATNGLDDSPLDNYSLKTFNPVTGALDGVADTRVELISGTTGAAGVPDNKGFFMFVRGDRSATNPQAYNPSGTVVETTLRDTGKIQLKNYTFNCTNVMGSYTLIGNPYPSPVNFATLNKTDIADQFWAWDPNLNQVGGYVLVDVSISPTQITTVPVGGLTSQDEHIQSSQAFFVKTINTISPKLEFAETSKSNIDKPNLFRPLSIKPASLAINLFTVNTDGSSHIADGVLAQFSTEYADETDELDGLKFGNINETFGITSKGTNYMLQRRQPLTENDTIFLSLKKSRQLNYRFDIMTGELSGSNLQGYLEDNFLHTSTPIDMNGKISVDFDVNGAAASSDPNRFRVVFKKAVHHTLVNAVQVNDDVAVDWSLINETDISSHEVERSADGIHFTGIGTVPSKGNSTESFYTLLDQQPATGIYYYRIKSAGVYGAVAYSDAVKVKVVRSSPGIYVFPNPVTDDNIHLQMNLATAGTYHIRLFNALGQQLLKQVISHPGGNSTHSFKRPQVMTGGTYSLEITGPDKNKSVLKIIVQ